MTDLFAYVDTLDDTPPAPPQEHVFTVADLSSALKQVVEGTFGRVAVEGEVGSCSRAASGHMYLTLTDQKTNATLDATVWKSRTFNRDVLQQGALVVVHGRVTTFPQRSRYQLDIERVEPAGLGRLLQLLEERKQRLASEGLFDADRKQPIPYLPRKIGCVTSETGAVIEDMLHRIADRCPRPVMLWPVPVQGTGAAEKIAAAIDGFNALPVDDQPDVLLVARGGGSLEDLMAFNEECVVRAIAASSIPVVSGVGHEPDVTLCDYAADFRAPTPTAAAEAVTPVRADLLFTLDTYQSRFTHSMTQKIQDHQRFLDLLHRGLPHPQTLLKQALSCLDEVEQRFVRGWAYRFTRVQDQLTQLERVLRSMAPQTVLKRGFVYATGKDGAVVRSAQAPAGAVTLHFYDGEREADLR